MSDAPPPTGASDVPAWQPPVDPGMPSQQAPTPQPGPAPQWTKPTQVGLIPLRPLTLGALLAATFNAFRRNPRPTLAIALGSQIATWILSAGIIALFLWAALPRLENTAAEDSDVVTAGTVFAAVLIYLVPIFFSVIAAALLQGIVVIEVSRAVLGEKLTLRQLWATAKGRFGALIGWSLLLMAALLLVIAALTAIIVLFITTLGVVGIVLSVLLGLFAIAGGAALAVWLGTKLSLVPSAIMIERLPLRTAIARSWTLISGRFWRTFGIQILVSSILALATNLVSAPFSFFAPMIASLLDPTASDNPSAIIAFAVVYVVMLILIVVLTAISMIIQSSTSALIYLDLRMRKEGLDLELARFVEERDSGVAPSGNPYTSPAARQPGTPLA
ncbi:hypothetical protein [Homoserinimonas hongtaonis]|nr:hypothetical protein [Salinibacterium hongtaonis]